MDLRGLKDREGNRSREPILIAALLCSAIVLFGLSWPVVKIALSSTGIPPLLLVCSRSGFAFLTLLVVALLRRRFSVPTRDDIPALFGIGILQLTGFFLLCHIAIKSVPASHTAILSNAAIIWVVPLSALMGRSEHQGKWFAALLSLNGIIVILQPWAIDFSRPQSAFGYGMLLAAALAWAGTIVISRNFPARMGASDLLLWSFGLSFALLLAFSVVSEIPLELPTGSIGYAFFNGALVAPVGTYCLITLAKRLSPTAAAISFLAIPIFGVLISCILLGETIDASLIIGSLLIFGGIVVASRF
ncbi:MAG: DMT family transporter [Pseudomonas sp.]|uniref:DMT family transporter n=1 Tax=Pseudomonas sp. TaxID=306 RepID=UPI001201F143|nr:DMT family transporter [Pseudomonas sp.]RZI72456.1 MAG: DMT family transporter [Pseudomonas sp.]